jgi:hypothetical protein
VVPAPTSRSRHFVEKNAAICRATRRSGRRPHAVEYHRTVTVENYKAGDRIEDVGAAPAFWSSDIARKVTGGVLHVDAGHVITARRRREPRRPT